MNDRAAPHLCGWFLTKPLPGLEQQSATGNVTGASSQFWCQICLRQKDHFYWLWKVSQLTLCFPTSTQKNGGMGFGNQLHEAGILQADLSLCRVQVLLITIITGVWINILSSFSNFSWPLGWDAASIGQKKRPGGQWGWMASVDWHVPELSCRGVTATAELCNAGKLV